MTDAMTYTTKPDGTATKIGREFDRPVAAKTGTSEENLSKWFSGFVPQMAVSVGTYKPTKDGSSSLSLTDEESVAPDGSTIPANIWLDFMVPTFDGVEVLPFPEREGLGDDDVPTETRTRTEAPRTTTGAAARPASRLRRRPADQDPTGQAEAAADHHDGGTDLTVTEPAAGADDDTTKRKPGTGTDDRVGPQGDDARPGGDGRHRGHRGSAGRYAARELPWMFTAAVLSALAVIPAGFGIALRVPACGPTGRATGSSGTRATPTCRTPTGTAVSRPGWLPSSRAPREPRRRGQPPLTGVMLTAVASLVPSADREGTRIAWYFALWAVVLTLLLLAVIWLVASSSRRPWTAAHVALAPVVALVGFVSADLLGVALASAGMWAWGRRHLAAAGVLLGLAISARSYPVLILVAIGLLALRSGRLPQFARTASYALATFLGVLGVLWLLHPEAAMSAYQVWVAAGPGYGSPWLLPQLAGHPLPIWAVTALAVLGWVIAILVGAVLALSSARRPTLAEVSLVMVGIVLVTGKSFTVQSSLWLVPLVAWSLVQWRDHLIWAAAEAVNFVAVWLNIAAGKVPDRGLPDPWYAFFSMLRVIAVLWLVAMVWLHARERWGRSEARARRPRRRHDRCGGPGTGPFHPDAGSSALGGLAAAGGQRRVSGRRFRCMPLGPVVLPGSPCALPPLGGLWRRPQHCRLDLRG